MNIFQNKIVWIFFLLALIFDFVIVYILAIFFPKYSHLKSVMSIMGNNNSPVKNIYNIWLILLGIILIFMGFSIFIQYKNISNNLSIIIFTILVLYGIGGCVLSGIFPVNEKREIGTIHSKSHGISAGICSIIYWIII